MGEQNFVEVDARARMKLCRAHAHTRTNAFSRANARFERKIEGDLWKVILQVIPRRRYTSYYFCLTTSRDMTMRETDRVELLPQGVYNCVRARKRASYKVLGILCVNIDCL